MVSLTIGQKQTFERYGCKKMIVDTKLPLPVYNIVSTNAV